MKTEDQLKELQTKIDTIKAFQGLKVSFPKTAISREILDAVSAEIAEFIQRKIIEIDTGSKVETAYLGSFTEEEVNVLKKLADTVIKKSNGTVAKNAQVDQMPPQPTSFDKDGYETAGVGLITNIIKQNVNNRKSKKAMYKEDEVKVFAVYKDKASIQLPSGTKMKVNSNELEYIG